MWHKGDRISLDSLLKKHLGWIEVRVRQRLGPKLRRVVETSDVVQDVAMEFLQYGPRFFLSDDNRFRCLLAKIVENNLRDKNDWYSARRRAIARQRPLPSDTILQLDGRIENVKTPSKSAQQHEEEAWIRLGMELLVAEDREVLVLRQWENRSFVEIGELLGLSPDAAWMRHSRAVGRLGKKVGELRRRNLDEVLEENQA
jgi:RNA polymerase sigma-70 factor (ECF subfamily)